jgi:hypothetical protein
MLSFITIAIMDFSLKYLRMKASDSKSVRKAPVKLLEFTRNKSREFSFSFLYIECLSPFIVQITRKVKIDGNAAL